MNENDEKKTPFIIDFLFSFEMYVKFTLESCSASLIQTDIHDNNYLCYINNIQYIPNALDVL